MTVKPTPRRRQRSAADQPSNRAHTDSAGPNGERRDANFNNVVERTSFGAAKEGMTEALGGSGALLRGALALRDMQIEAARRTQAVHQRAQQQLQSARSMAELSGVGLLLAQADAEGAARYWSDAAGIAARSAFETWNEAFGALARAQGLAQSFGQHWIGAAAAAKPDTLEAQVEHMTTPVTSSPFVWPAQEAVREAMTLGARNWSEWLANAAPAGKAPATRH